MGDKKLVHASALQSKPVRLMYLPEVYLEELNFTGPEKNFKANISLCYLPQNFYKKAVKYLHPEEQKYYETLRFEKRIKSYLLGRYAAKLAVGFFTGEEKLERILIKRGIFNQPVVTYPDGENIQVSITHSDDFGAAVAFSEACPMGIDLEKICLDKADILETQITELENDLIRYLIKIASYSNIAWLTLFWAAKEALSKVLRTGLTTPLSIYEINKIDINNGYIISHFKNFPQYYNFSFQLNHYIFSVTFPQKTKSDFNMPALKKKFSLFMKEDR